MPLPNSPLSADEILEREFLPLRSRLLDIAAALDRFERASDDHLEAKPAEAKSSEAKLSETNATKMRLAQVEEALQILLDSANSDRAERIQQLFSREYDANWHTNWLASNQEQIGRNSPSIDDKKEDA